MTSRSVVIGAGVLGLSTAVNLARRGHAVIVVDRSEPRNGTSGTSFAWLNANSKVPRSYHDLNVAGVAAYRHLIERPGSGSWLRLNGRIQWGGRGEGQRELAQSVAMMREWGYPVQSITQREAHELEPDLRIPPGSEIVFWPSEGYLIPQIRISVLVAEARELGVTFELGREVTAFEERGGAVPAAVLGDGATIEADTIVACAGRWTEELLSLAGARLPMIAAIRGGPTLGLLGYSSRVPTRLERTISAPGLNVRPDAPEGRFVLQAPDFDQFVEPDATPDSTGPEAREMLARATSILDGFADAALDELRVGFRSIPADRVTAVGWTPGVERLYAIATHSGFTLAVLLGELAAREIVDGTEEPMLYGFRLDRFAERGPVGG